MTSQPSQVRLVAYPSGIPGDDVWKITHDSPPELGDSEIEVDVQLISIDPGMKGWATPMRSYIEPVALGDVMRAFGIGPVVRSASNFFSEGDVASGFTGVQTRAVVDSRSMRPIDMALGPIGHHMSVLGMTGFTGYFGMLDLGRPEASDTVVVSAASGAVGSVAAQIAKRQGARVVGGYAALYDTTPDWMPFFGPRRELAGYYDACGGSGHAFKTGPIMARELADWLLDGRVEDDFRQLGFDRIADDRMFVSTFGGNRG